jgi:hypothetical protein
MNVLRLIVLSISLLIHATALGNHKPSAFPYDMPDKKPARTLSKAVARNYQQYLGTRPESNDLYSQFKYTQLKGFDYNKGDGTISRRDPSKIIYENGKYYVWYTKRHTKVPPIGMHNAERADTETPTSDWDLSDIYYATSTDGFEWKEQGVAVPRPAKPKIGWRSVTTTDILKWQGKYYLYYQAFSETIGLRGEYCPVAVSYADSPDGPWIPVEQEIIPNGQPGEWDQFSIHDPYPLVHNNQVYLYYKSDFARDKEKNKGFVRMAGLAIADNPLGPFKKHPLNPVINSGHEVALFPYKDGVAAFSTRDGNEKNTIQYAKDWVNFEVASHVELMPNAAGPFVVDAFTNTQNGRGITWGLSHFVRGGWTKRYKFLARWDADLSQDIHDPQMKHHYNKLSPEIHFSFALSNKQKERIESQNKQLRTIKQ